MATGIHETAIIGRTAVIGPDTTIGPYTIIEDGAEIGAGCFIDSCVKICAGVKMGDKNEVFHGTLLGGPPQNIGFDYSLKSGVTIGDRNIFREQSSVHRSIYANQTTVVGSDNYIMATGHIAHDCRVGDHTIMANGAMLAGHVVVGSYAFVSGNVVVHQFCRLGDYCMISGGTRINQDVPPFALITASEGMGHIIGTNVVGLKRGGFQPEDRKAIKAAFKIMCWSSLSMADIIQTLSNDTNPHVQMIAEFLKGSERGLCSAVRKK